MKVRSVVTYFAEDIVLQAIGSKLLCMLYLCKKKRVLGDPSTVALESLMACWCSLLRKLFSLIFFSFPFFTIHCRRLWGPYIYNNANKKYVFNRNVAEITQR